MNRELLAKRPCVTVMLSLLGSIGVVMNHISLFLDLLWVTDTQSVSCSVLTSALSFSLVSLCPPDESEYWR